MPLSYQVNCLNRNYVCQPINVFTAHIECFVMDFTKWSISTKRENFAISREEISVKNQKIYDSKKALLLLNFSNRSNFAEKLPSTTMTTKRPQNSIQEKYLAEGILVWYFVTKIVLTYCEKKLF